MYTRMYHLDDQKYHQDMNQVKAAIMNLNGVSDVKIISETSSLVVEFDHRLSEKQILSTINQYKKHTRH